MERVFIVNLKGDITIKGIDLEITKAFINLKNKIENGNFSKNRK